MEKDKQEQLKDALNKTLSAKDIEKKLKSERDSISSINASKPKKNDNKEKEEKKVHISSVADKSDIDETSILKYLIVIALLLLLLVIYLFFKDDFLTTSNEKEINNKVEKTIEQANLTKKDEPTKQEVITKEKKDTEPLKEEVPKPKNEENISKEASINTETKSIEKKNESTLEEKDTKEIVKEKSVNLERSDFKKFYNSAKYNILKCYNFKAGDILPTSDCKTNLKKFIDENKNALRFEVIPVIAEDDNLVFDKLKDNIKNLDKTFQDRVKEYMFRGLSRERVLQTTWEIKELSPKGTIITPTNFYVKSKKNNKGVIIRAYY